MTAASETAAPRRAPDLLVVAAWLLALAPGIWLAADTLRTVAGAYTPSPFWDQWGTVSEYAQARAGGLSWPLLFGQSNEHRILFPRLVMFADLHWFGGRNGLPYAGILVGQTALVALFGVIAASLRHRAAALLALGAVAALTFSLGQWENLIWAFQVQFLMVAAAGAWSIFLFCRAFARPGRIGYGAWAGSLVLLVVAAFSMANGMVAGAASVGVALLARFPWQAAVGQGLAVAAIAALYFQGYVPVPFDRPSGLGAALAEPVAFLQFLAVYLGNPARAFGVVACMLLGAVGLVASLAAALRLLLRRDAEPGRIALVGIMAFVVASAAITALGRIGYGPAQGLVPRYLTFGLMFWAAQALYWVSLAPARRPLALLSLAAAVALLAYPPLWRLQAHSKPDLASREAQMELGVRVLRAGSDDPAALAGLNWNVPMMLQQVEFLRRERLSLFAAAPREAIGRVLSADAVAGPGACLGSFDAILPAPGGGSGWRAGGWAWDVRAARPITTVLLVDPAGRVQAAGVGGGYRPDVRPVVKQVRSDHTGWMAALPRRLEGPLTAYGVALGGRRCELGRLGWP